MAMPRPEPHSRTPSHGSSSSGSSTHRMILEHILTYPGTYELPLRTMYALNSAPQTHVRPRSSKGGVATPNNDAAQQLTSSLMAEMSQMPNQPTSLPPSFITSFVRKCFAAELQMVDFPQALTGLDYLKDLEARRCREMKAALERLGVSAVDPEINLDLLATRYPAAADWYRSLDGKIRKVEALYAQLFVVLRRWILINELSLSPYSKHNCVAMLNTVYPPVASTSLPSRLEPSMLRAQRDGFFKYIQAVERQGTAILANLIAQDRRSGEETGWPSARAVLDKYLQLANSIIDESTLILDINDAANIHAQEVRRKADSGIDFVKPSSSSSRKSSTSSTDDKTKDLDRPASASRQQSYQQPQFQQPQQPQYKSSSSTLEKIARELRHMRRTKTDVSEIIIMSNDRRDESAVNDTNNTNANNSSSNVANSDGPTQAPAPSSRPEKPSSGGGLRKMKSFSSIGLRSRSSRSHLSQDAKLQAQQEPVPKFDVEELRRQRSKAFGTPTMAAVHV